MYLEVKNVKKSYGKDSSYIQVLKGVSTSVEKGQMCVIQGTSGSGKSTLLNCIGGLDTMDSGSVTVDGKEIFGLKPLELSDYRRDNLGFIFQFYNLVPNLTVKENIQVCSYLTDDPLDLDELLEVLQQGYDVFRAAQILEVNPVLLNIKLYELNDEGYNFDTSWSTTRLY